MTEAASCTRPLFWETLVAYWAHDLPADEEEAAELHLMGCAACTGESRRVAAVTDGLRTAPPGRPKRRWILGSAATGAALAAAAAAILLLVPTAPRSVAYHLASPVRDAAAVELAPPPAVRDVRLVPELAGGVTANAARVRRLDGAWLTVRVEAGPPLSVIVPRAELTPGRYEVELVSVAPGGVEQSRGFYRFVIPSP